MAHISVTGLTFAYPGAKEPALSDVSFQVKAGECVCLMGPTGSGKTTLLRMLKSALAPHGERSGTIQMDGQPLEDIPDGKQASLIGLLMQSPDDQLVCDKVWHELAFGLECTGVPRAVMRARVAEVASYFGLQGIMHKSVHELSGGQKQMVNLASVMAMQPDILLLDEPTSQLDPIAASELIATIAKLNQETGITVIISEHRLDEVLPQADRVLVLEGGALIEDATPREAVRSLLAKGSGMQGWLPVPARIADEVDGGGDIPLPLTVREGRAWLEARVRKAPPLEEASDAAAWHGANGAKDAAVTVKDAWFRYERHGADVLKGVSLQAPAGAILALMGGNGSGKTTLLRCICKALKPYRGHIEADQARMLPQDPTSIFAHQTIGEELLEMVSGTGAEAMDQVQEMAHACGIERILGCHPFDVSGGEQELTALAKVLLTHPQTLLLDEPTKALDASAKARLASKLRALADGGTCVIMASHDVEFCAENADSISMLFDGEASSCQDVRSFFSGNAFYTTAASRMSRNIFECAVTAEDVVRLCRS